MKRRQATMGWVALLVACVVSACGGGQTRIGKVFDTDWQDDGGRSIHAAWERISGFQVPKGANVAVGVTDAGLAGVSLDSGKHWSFAHAVDSRPFVTGDVVVGTGAGAVFALEASTGNKLWERSAGGMIRGAGDDGHTTVVSLAPSSHRGGVLLAIGREGNVVRQLEVDVGAGTPALVANVAFIPWQNQYITVYDLSSGDEVARATLRQQTSHAITVGGALYFGELGLTKFDADIGAASHNKANHMDLPARELPGSPRWMRSGGSPLKPDSDAFDRIRLYARPDRRRCVFPWRGAVR